MQGGRCSRDVASCVERGAALGTPGRRSGLRRGERVRFSGRRPASDGGRHRASDGDEVLAGTGTRGDHSAPIRRGLGHGGIRRARQRPTRRGVSLTTLLLGPRGSRGGRPAGAPSRRQPPHVTVMGGGGGGFFFFFRSCWHRVEVRAGRARCPIEIMRPRALRLAHALREEGPFDLAG